MALSEKQLANCVRDAARIRVIVEPRIRDEDFQKQNGTIFYAVDTNVIKLYTDPKKVSLRYGNREGYAEIFDGDKRESVYILGQAFAQYIFYHLRKELPLLQIPPHEEETLRVFLAIAKKSTIAMEDLSNDARIVRGLLADFQKYNDKQKLIEGLRKYTPNFLRLRYGGSTPLDELKRFSNLLKDKRIASFSYLFENNKQIDNLDLSILRPFATIEDLEMFSGLKNRWFNQLHDAKSNELSNVIINDDANVLARLEWINHALSKEDKRLILITGDKALTKVAEAYPVSNELSFSDLYIRHPKAFIADKAFLKGVKLGKRKETMSELFTLINWLDVFLSEFSDPDADDYLEKLRDIERANLSKLNRLAKNALKRDPSLGEQLLIDWEALVNTVAWSYSIGIDNKYDNADKAAHELIDSLKKNNDIDEIVDEAVRIAWKEFFDIAVVGGVLLLYSKDKSIFLSRNAPIIRFLNKKYAKEYVESFLSSKKTVPEIDLQKVLEEDKSKYSYYMAHAVLYASAGRWSIAHKIAELALNISDTEKWHDMHVFGHEAAYLIAVSLRRKSRQISDLEKVGDYIDEAEKRLNLLDASQPNQQILPDYRFEHERIALSLTYWLYSSFTKHTVELTNVMPLIECGEKLLDLLPKIKGLCKSEGIVIWKALMVQAITNLFMITLLNKFKFDSVLDHLDSIKDYLRIFELFLHQKKKSTQGVKLSFSQRTIYFTMASWLCKGIDKDKAKQELFDLLDGTNIEKHSILPYDKQRYQFLRDIIANQDYLTIGSTTPTINN